MGDTSKQPAAEGAHSLGQAIYRAVLAFVLLYLAVVLVLMFIWDSEPDRLPLNTDAQSLARAQAGGAATPGLLTTQTAIQIAELLLDKSGGYLRNDIMPPGVWMDNVPEWEFGVVVQLRDFARVMRNDLSRSQSQSEENSNLAAAEGNFFFTSDVWWLPATENQYRSGIKELKSYLEDLSDPNNATALFFPRADNMATWFRTMETRLGSLSQRLSTSVNKQTAANVGAAGQPGSNEQTGIAPASSWFEIDNVFYEARGQTYALLHFLRAAEQDFAPVLKDKNATFMLRQIIETLEHTQDTLWSPMILNGSGFSFWPNHSLVMASYIATANASLIDLRQLLADG